MIRPGMSNPGMGAQRTNEMRKRLAQMMQQQRGGQRGPRFAGGLGRRPVAGPGVRQFQGRGPLQPSALDSLTERFGGGTVPFGRPVAGLPDGAGPGIPDQLPDPAVGPRGPQDFSPRLPGDVLDRLRGDFNDQPQRPSWEGQLDPSWQPGATTGDVGGLIPLGGGAYFDPSSGMLYGAGGQQGF